MSRKKHVWDTVEIEKLAALGLTQEEIAYNCGASPATWYAHIKEGNSDILEAYKRGKGKHAKLVIGKLAQLGSQGNVSALIFLAKAHHGRRENIVLTHEGNADNPVHMAVDYTKLTPEQRRARIAELERKRQKREG
jgi:hypothetical protein